MEYRLLNQRQTSMSRHTTYDVRPKCRIPTSLPFTKPIYKLHTVNDVRNTMLTFFLDFAKSHSISAGTIAAAMFGYSPYPITYRTDTRPLAEKVQSTRTRCRRPRSPRPGGHNCYGR